MDTTNQNFPLFSPTTERTIWKHTPVNREREAAVLVPLVSCGGQPSLLFTTRSSRLREHASEVAFPGGHFDEATDASLEATAIREAREELLGDEDETEAEAETFPWGKVEIIGRASPLPSISGMPVTPVIAVLPGEITGDVGHTFPGRPGEVEDVFCVSLQELLAVETSQRSERFRTDVPVFRAKKGKKIWGLTAIITRPLLHKLFKPAFFDP
eukprot:jgi/Psemu1/195795/e_gw1.177.78.1